MLNFEKLNLLFITTGGTTSAGSTDATDDAGVAEGAETSTTRETRTTGEVLGETTVVDETSTTGVDSEDETGEPVEEESAGAAALKERIKPRVEEGRKNMAETAEESGMGLDDGYGPELDQAVEENSKKYGKALDTVNDGDFKSTEDMIAALDVDGDVKITIQDEIIADHPELGKVSLQGMANEHGIVLSKEAAADPELAKQIIMEGISERFYQETMGAHSNGDFGGEVNTQMTDGTEAADEFAEENTMDDTVTIGGEAKAEKAKGKTKETETDKADGDKKANDDKKSDGDKKADGDAESNDADKAGDTKGSGVSEAIGKTGGEESAKKTGPLTETTKKTTEETTKKTTEETTTTETSGGGSAEALGEIKEDEEDEDVKKSSAKGGGTGGAEAAAETSGSGTAEGLGEPVLKEEEEAKPSQPAAADDTSETAATEETPTTTSAEGLGDMIPLEEDEKDFTGLNDIINDPVDTGFEEAVGLIGEAYSSDDMSPDEKADLAARFEETAGKLEAEIDKMVEDGADPADIEAKQEMLDNLQDTFDGLNSDDAAKKEQARMDAEMAMKGAGYDHETKEFTAVEADEDKTDPTAKTAEGSGTDTTITDSEGASTETDDEQG